MHEIKYKPIGIIHSPFKEPKGTPIQPAGGKDIDETVEGFSHIILIFHFHLSRGVSLKVKPYMDNEERGVFAIRGPSRPNPIGISIVRLVGIEENILHIKDLDMIDGTPLLDIKPYIPEFDIQEVAKIGWLEKNIHKLPTSKDDGRFMK